MWSGQTDTKERERSTDRVALKAARTQISEDGPLDTPLTPDYKAAMSVAESVL